MQLTELPGQGVDIRRHLKVVEARAEAAEATAIEARAALAKAVLGAAQAEALAIEANTQAIAELERENQDLRDALLKAQMMVSALEDRLEALYQHPAQVSEILRHHAGEDDLEDPEDPEEVSAPQAPIPPVMPPAEALAADSRIPTSVLSAGTAGPRMAAASRRQHALAPGRVALGVPAAFLCVAVVLFPSASLMDFDVRDASWTVEDGKVAMRRSAPIERPKLQSESASRPTAVPLVTDRVTINLKSPRLKLAKDAAVSMRAAAPHREPLRRAANEPTVAVSADRMPSGSWLLWMPIEREAIERAMKNASPASSASPPYPPNAPRASQAALLTP